MTALAKPSYYNPLMVAAILFGQIALSLGGPSSRLRGPIPVAQAASQTQEHLTYQNVISAMPWDPAKNGPLIAPCPLGWAPATTLEAMKRKKVRIGGLTAVVPTEMVTLNTHFTEAPNLYDGLPRDAKVLYLLTLLSEDQWRKTTGDGLSLADCHGEQTAVLQSIIPNPFQWNIVTAVAPNGWTNNPSDASPQLSDDDRRQVKLKLVRDIDLTLPLMNHGGFTGTGVSDSLTTGKKYRWLKDDTGDEFGQHIKVVSDNIPRKSQLDLNSGRYDVPVPLKNGELLADLAARVAAATGLELYVDPHYMRMRMVEIGDQAPARDRLRALALGVTGTYRKVESAYVLTSDLEGVAAQQARLAAFEDDLDKIVSQRKDLWRSIIGKTGQVQKVKYGAGEGDSLTQAEQANIAHNDVADSNDDYMNTADAGDAVRNAVQTFEGGGLNLDQAHVGVHTTIRFQLVMPDGQAPMGGGYVATASGFRPNPYIWRPRTPPLVALPMSASDAVTGIILHADSPGQAREDVDRARSIGVKELWLETDDAAAIQEAVKAASGQGIEVRAAVRPWAITDPTRSAVFDRTAAGLHGRGLADSKSQYLAWNEFWQDIGAYEPFTREQMAPKSPQLPDRWSQIEKLAAPPGLAGVSLLDAYPTGYAKEISRSSGSYFYSEAVDLFMSYGYSEAQRLAYLRSEHVDPLDIESNNTRTKVSLDAV